MELNLQQVLLLLALLSGVWTDKKPRCYRSHELEEAAQRKLHLLFPQAAERAPSAAGSSACPLELYAYMKDENHRSLSPWRYETVALPDHYPSSYVRAACLCSGCIQFKDGVAFQSFDFNSITVNQSRIFLRRQLCDDGATYQLVPITIKVPVGCTCVRPTWQEPSA